MDIFVQPFGRDLYGKKNVSRFMDTQPLVVEHTTSFKEASQYITKNSGTTFIQDFIIAKQGRYSGMGNILSLLESITTLQINQLKAENTRLSTELDVTRRLQQMLLPKECELSQISGLEIAGFMEPADEVGGDYYDVLKHGGRVKIGIGDVTGHGLESGVLMLMVQTAVRTLLAVNETDPVKFLNAVNSTIYSNTQRMDADKTMSLILLDYVPDDKSIGDGGTVLLSGQHEEVLVVRVGGEVERVRTDMLGFPIGLEENISEFVAQVKIHLNTGDSIVLYTDGITEAQNDAKILYGVKRLCEVLEKNWHKSANEIREILIEDLRSHIGKKKLQDDITLLVLQQT
ncbi:SpoIIE family protein phosphatase [Beggiatoa leptomitoformis]|uniref:SpoIIE family protein phosphatase n=2 Tax=Beggiatoa leptomitoformis TaxID=288004 RepID=A0A2N9YFS9_9GAMM|nr:SpoIIE family protein phosphatase [Beggiatoa leptomitoformis]QGX03726.1 SpoIIE family protein phosphatase [Beggiatoa leptomitoformis]